MTIIHILWEDFMWGRCNGQGLITMITAYMRCNHLDDQTFAMGQAAINTILNWKDTP